MKKKNRNVTKYQMTCLHLRTPGCGEEAHLIYCAESKGTSEREF
jgi:hypothetical protein